jgi:hypothetical protein
MRGGRQFEEERLKGIVKAGEAFVCRQCCSFCRSSGARYRNVGALLEADGGAQQGLEEARSSAFWFNSVLGLHGNSRTPWSL